LVQSGVNNPFVAIPLQLTVLPTKVTTFTF